MSPSPSWNSRCSPRRPRRTVADGSDYGAEITNGAAEEPRLRLAHRMRGSGLLAACEPSRGVSASGAVRIRLIRRNTPTPPLSHEEKRS